MLKINKHRNVRIESLSFTYTANGKRQIQVENFLKIENEQMKIGQNNSYGQKLSETTNQGVEMMNSN